MSVKQVIKMPDFEADQQDAMKRTDNIQSLADQVERLEAVVTTIDAAEDNLKLLSIIFGLNSLSTVLKGGDTKKARTINPTNFNGVDLIPALEEVSRFSSKSKDFEDFVDDYPIFQSIVDNVNMVVTELDDPPNGEEAARRMAVRFLTSKLGRKPRDGGYLASVMKNGNCLFYGIDLEKMANDPNLLNNMGSSQSSMVINFIKTFPPS